MADPEIVSMKIKNHDIANIVALLRDIQVEMLKSESAGLRTSLTGANRALFKGQLAAVTQRIEDLKPVDLPVTHGDTIYEIGETGPQVVKIPDV